MARHLDGVCRVCLRRDELGRVWCGMVSPPQAAWLRAGIDGRQSNVIRTAGAGRLKELEGLRLCSRVAPMLGLVATMIPMGPALVAVASGQSSGVAESLAPAFAAVIVALVAASITFVIYSVRRRWLLAEMLAVLDGTPA